MNKLVFFFAIALLPSISACADRNSIPPVLGVAKEYSPPVGVTARQSPLPL